MRAFLPASTPHTHHESCCAESPLQIHTQELEMSSCHPAGFGMGWKLLWETILPSITHTVSEGWVVICGGEVNENTKIHNSPPIRFNGSPHLSGNT